MMKHNAVLIGLVILIAGAFAIPVGAGTAAIDDRTKIEIKDDKDIVKSDWLNYIGQSIGLTSAYTEYQFCNPSKEALAVDMAAKSKDTMDYYFTDLKDSVKNSWLEVRTNETTKYSQWVPDIKCVDDVTKNGTKFKNCTDNGKSVDMQGWNWKWSKLTGKEDFKSGGCYNIRLHATYPVAFGKDAIAVDNVMQVKGYTYDEYDWWNTSWNYRKNVTINVPGSNQPVRFWLNGTDGHLANCNEIRMSDFSGTEVSSNVIWNYVSGGNYNCEVLLLADYTKNYSAYYGNTGIGPPSYTNVLLYADNFYRLESQWNCNPGEVVFATVTGGYMKLKAASGGLPEAWCFLNGTGIKDAAWGWKDYTFQVNLSYTAVLTGGPNMISYASKTGCAWDGSGVTLFGECYNPLQVTTGYKYYSVNRYRLAEARSTILSTQGDVTFSAGSNFQTMRSNISNSGADVIINDDYRPELTETFVSIDADKFPTTDSGTSLFNGTIGLLEAENVENRWQGVFVWKGGGISEPRFPASEPTVTLATEETNGPNAYIMVSDESVNPASPQTFPPADIKFGINFTAVAGSIDTGWLEANFTGTTLKYVMTNASEIYNRTFGGLGAGTYAYKFNANLTTGVANGTTQSFFIVNQATGSATASSTAGWLYLTGLPTTLSCAGTTPKLYLDHLLITNPYTATLAVGTYSVVCNSTDTVNYTAASDSKSLQVLPAGIVTSAYDETTGSELVYNLTFYNASYSRSWTNLGITFFGLGNTSLPTGLVTLEFSSNLYGQRTYYRTVGGGVLENMTAYLLPLASGSYIRFHTLTYTEVGIPGALVQVNRSIGGVNTLIGEMTSDSTGTATFFLNPLVSYTVYPSKVGYTAGASSITPSGSDYKLYMTAIGTVNVTTQFSNLVWNFTPACGGITNSTTTFFYYISDSNSSLNSYGFNVSLPNGTTYSVSGTLPGGSTLNLTLDLRNFSGQTVNITRWFNETGYPLYVFRYGCIVWNTATGNSLLGQLNALKAGFCPMPAAGEIPWCLPLNIMALMVTTAVGAIGAARFGANGGGMAAAATLWVFTFLTWWPWQPALLLTLGMIGVMVMTRRLG